MKINVDGSRKASTGLSACGGVVKDHMGQFVRAFPCRLGTCSATHAELWGLFYGLSLART